MILPLSASKSSFLSFLPLSISTSLVPRPLRFRKGRISPVFSLPENSRRPENLRAGRGFPYRCKYSFASLCVNAAPMTEIQYEKSQFTKTINLQAIRVPKTACTEVSRILNKYLFDMPRLRNIVWDSTDPDMRLVLLSPRITDAALSGLPAPVKEKLTSGGFTDVLAHDVVLDYSYWPADEVLSKLLPPGIEVPTSFETIGHVAHLNLRDELLPFKHTIGAVLLDKNHPRIRSIVNKVGSIKSQFRVPHLEVLAGDACLTTEVKQHGARFRLDYGTVYWNSRLEAEHKRVVTQLRVGDTVVDLFAGVGPFAIPAAQKGCVVYANDLNPDSVTYLRENAAVNQVEEGVKAFCMDAREFMRHICTPSPPVTQTEGDGVKSEPQARVCEDESAAHPPAAEEVTGSRQPEVERAGDGNPPGGTSERSGKKRKKVAVCSVPPWEHFDHAIMNLPATAIDFLDVFRGLLVEGRWRGPLPRIHCYCFAKSHETDDDVIKRAERALGGAIRAPSVYTVRDVAPNKIMKCISFQLPSEVAFHSK